jgi:hypothetical protein
VDTDCDDTDDSVYPTASDPDGDGVDTNCDGLDGVGASLGTFVAFDPPRPQFSLEAGFTIVQAQLDDDAELELLASAYHWERFPDHADPGNGAAWILDGPELAVAASWEGDKYALLGEYVAVGRFVGDDEIDDVVLATLNDLYLFDGSSLASTRLEDAKRISTHITEEDPHVTRTYSLSTATLSPESPAMLTAAIWPGLVSPEVRFYELEVEASIHLDDYRATIEGWSDRTRVTNVQWLSDSPFEVARHDHTAGPGRVHVARSWDGLSSLSAPEEASVLEGEHQGDWFGDTVSSSSALDGSGDRVLLVGAMGYPRNASAGKLYAMREGQKPATADWTFTGRPDGVHRLGRDFATADLDGDGILDLAIGAPADGNDPDLTRVHSGAVHVFFGPIAPGHYSSDDADLSLVGETTGDMAGWSLEAADFTGDGQADLAIGAPGHDSNDGTQDVGRVYLVEGPLR